MKAKLANFRPRLGLSPVRCRIFMRVFQWLRAGH